MSASRVKSVSFKEDKKHLLEYAEKKGNFSEYVLKLIEADMNKGYQFPYEQEQAIIRLIKKYAPTVTEEQIKNDIDQDAVDALNQF